jgi:hypothetical protein
MSSVSNHQPEVIDALNTQDDGCDHRGRLPVKTRKPRPKPERFVRLVVPPVDGPGHVIITVGKESTDYTLERLESPLGNAFCLTKCSPVPDGEETTYNVLLAANGNRCDCKGFARWDRCKHADSLAVLLAHGKL